MIKTIAAAAALALAIGGQALASETAPRAEVRFTDLQLASPEGQAQLQNRIKSAARSVCAIGGQFESLQVKRLEQTCFKTAMSSARQQVLAMTERSAARNSSLAALDTSNTQVPTKR